MIFSPSLRVFKLFIWGQKLVSESTKECVESKVKWKWNMLAWWGGQCSKSSARTSHQRWQSSPWSTHKTISLAVSDLTTDMELCCWIAFRVKLFLPIADVGNLPAGCGRQWAVGVHARPGQACYLSVSGNWASLATAATCTGLVGSHRLPSWASSRPTCPVGTSLVECFVYFCYKWWN